MNGVRSTEADRRVIDPYGPGRLTVQLEKRDGDFMAARVELPINALFAPRLCSDGREARITWKFCPWTGERLGRPLDGSPASGGMRPPVTEGSRRRTAR
jgi:hypothetical protein